MTKELLERHPHPTAEQIRYYLSGNLCRCAACPDTVQAVHALSESENAKEAKHSKD
jgi:carbon-monoxide dehydrogenase small subunit